MRWYMDDPHDEDSPRHASDLAIETASIVKTHVEWCARLQIGLLGAVVVTASAVFGGWLSLSTSSTTATTKIDRLEQEVREGRQNADEFEKDMRHQLQELEKILWPLAQKKDSR